MRSEAAGKGTSKAEVTNISRHGIWILVGDEELFLPMKDFPWFASAPVSAVLNLVCPRAGHLYWPDLDVDLELDSIRHPEKYPLVSKVCDPSGQ